MKPHSPTTLRWYITNRWADPAAQPEALRLIDDIVGYAAPDRGGAAPSTPPPPEQELVEAAPPNDQATTPRKVALVIGHNSTAKGAWADQPVGSFEYDFNNGVVTHLLGRAPASGLAFRRFLRLPGGGYNAEIDRCYQAVNAWQPELVIELHFNGGGGDYATMLHARGSAAGTRAAAAMQRTFSTRLGVRDWGLMPRDRSDRGGRSLWAAAAPAVLTEPFFGDNPRHVQRVANLGVPGIADIYLDAIAAALDALNP